MPRVFASKGRLSLIGGFLFAFLVVLNVATYFLYKQAQSYLDNELGERLRSIAVTLSHSPNVRFGPSADDPELVALLRAVKTDNLLSNIVLLTRDGETIVDVGNFSQPGEQNPFIELDYTAVTLARSGLPAYTNLYRSADIYLKSAYAPVFDDNNVVVGIIGVEAGATYFDVLRALGRLILVVNVSSVVIVVMLALFFYHQSVTLDRAQAAIIRGENLATMGRMVAGIAHEIRNPLSIIKTSAERLQKRYGPDDEVLTYISEEVDELDRILTGYLNFAKAGRQDSQPHSIEKIITRCLRIVDDDIRSKQVRVVRSAPEGPVNVMGDDKRLQQAVLNILINALQAVDTRGEIRIAVEEASKQVVVRIEDNGHGIETRVLKEVTKPFFTTRKQGSGLGMSIVSNIIEEHHGELAIKSEPGRGTEVILSLPRA